MEDQNRNLILATALSFLVILVWFIMFPPPEPVADPNATQTSQSASGPSADSTPSSAGGTAIGGDETPDNVADAPRVAIRSDRLHGSLSLAGGRIDDLQLTGYRETIDETSPDVTLFRPVGEAEAYYALYGWAPGAGLEFDDVPGANTVWTLASGTELTPSTPVTLRWSNGKGQTFTREISLDEDYLFTVTQSITNTGSEAVRLAPNNALVHVNQPSDQKGFFILHEGAIRQTGVERNYIPWDDMTEADRDDRWGPTSDAVRVDQNGWVGFTDHYWMAMLVPAPDQSFEAVLQYVAATDEYKSIARLETLSVEPGSTATVSSQLFAGAKEWDTIRRYENESGIYEFSAGKLGRYLLVDADSLHAIPVLPALNGFIGEFTVLVGVFQTSKVWAAFGATGIVLGAAYMLWLYQRVFFGELSNEKNFELSDLNLREQWTLIPLIVICFWIGLYPKPFFDRMQPTVTRVMEARAVRDRILERYPDPSQSRFLV